jgi:hypothetical protein
MRSFLIKPPAKGKTTCSLVRQYYDAVDHRTKTQYLGSVNLATDPDNLPEGLRLGLNVELDDFQLMEVRWWLERHGTYGHMPSLPPGVEEKLHASIRAQVERELCAALPPVPERAVKALVEAGRYIDNETTRLIGAGVKLSKGMLNSIGTDTGLCYTELDLLKVRANEIRAAFLEFQRALKDARLMKKVCRGTKSISVGVSARRQSATPGD